MEDIRHIPSVGQAPRRPVEKRAPRNPRREPDRDPESGPGETTESASADGPARPERIDIQV